MIERYRVLNRFQWHGQWYERGDAISRDVILADANVGVSRLGSLQRTRFIEPDPVTRPLDKMTKAELIDHARDLGASFDASWRKSDILEAVQEAIHGT